MSRRVERRHNVGWALLSVGIAAAVLAGPGAGHAQDPQAAKPAASGKAIAPVFAKQSGAQASVSASLRPAGENRATIRPKPKEDPTSQPSSAGGGKATIRPKSKPDESTQNPSSSKDRPTIRPKDKQDQPPPPAGSKDKPTIRPQPKDDQQPPAAPADWGVKTVQFRHQPPRDNASASSSGPTIRPLYHVVERYVATRIQEPRQPEKAGFVKLFMTWEALCQNDPRRGFNNYNTFEDSCGPDAAMNLLRWYGIDQMANPRFSVQTLGNKMHTNDWAIEFLVRLYDGHGTTTPFFVSTVKEHAQQYMPSGYEFHYQHDGNTFYYYHQFWMILSEGNPIAVNYKTGSRKGHFAVIIGMEKVRDPDHFSGDGRDDSGYYDINNDKVLLANGSDMTWSQFCDVWQRDYGAVANLVLPAYDEYPYSHVYLRQEGATNPSLPSGGGAHADHPPTHVK